MAKSKKPSAADRRAEYEAGCRAMFDGLREPITAVFRKLLRKRKVPDGPLVFVVWEWYGEDGPGVTIGLEDAGPPFAGDFAGFDAFEAKPWPRTLDGLFRDVFVRVLGEWWLAAGGEKYPRPVVIGEHDLNDWVDLRTGRPTEI